MGLRKGQKELVELFRGGYCAVPAIPGGGKTHCLSLWAVEIIAQGLCKPGKILIVTYMNTAVNNFKQRISKALQERGITSGKDYFVSTIHGLCLQIIKEKPDYLMASDEFTIVDEVTKVHIMQNAVDEWRKRNEDLFRSFMDQSGLSANKVAETCKTWQDKFCGVVLTAIGDFKTRGMDPKQAKALCRGLGGSSFLRCAADLYELYDRKLKIGGFMDFDDMLYNAKKLLMEDEVLLDKYRKKYTFVCEDEAQDSNRIQSEILELIANGNLLKVGDSNQAICGSFSNSDFTLFKDFCTRPETTVYQITQSSRNTTDIIGLANHFVRYVREQHPVAECRDSLLPQFIEPVALDDSRPNPVTPEYGIKSAVFPSWEEEARGVVGEVQRVLKARPEKTLAILVPSAWKIKDIVHILESRHVPYEQLDNTSRERNRVVRYIGRIIDFIACPENGQKLADMMLECFLTGPEDGESSGIEAVDAAYAKEREVLSGFLVSYPVERILYPATGEIAAAEVPEELGKTRVWAAFLDKLELVRELLEFPSTVVEKLILYISEKLEFDREERAIAQKIAGDVRYLMSQDPRWRLSDLALELLNPKNSFSYFAGVVWELKGYEPKPGLVTVATYHKSKGLEWDTVFLTGLNYADFPVGLQDKFIGEYWFLKQEYKNPQAIVRAEMEALLEGGDPGDAILKSKLETISEKARLLYVGITRAREYLLLSGFHANQGKRNEAPPSKYLLELKRFIEEEGVKCSRT